MGTIVINNIYTQVLNNHPGVRLRITEIDSLGVLESWYSEKLGPEYTTNYRSVDLERCMYLSEKTELKTTEVLQIMRDLIWWGDRSRWSVEDFFIAHFYDDPKNLEAWEEMLEIFLASGLFDPVMTEKYSKLWWKIISETKRGREIIRRTALDSTGFSRFIDYSILKKLGYTWKPGDIPYGFDDRKVIEKVLTDIFSDPSRYPEWPEQIKDFIDSHYQIGPDCMKLIYDNILTHPDIDTYEKGMIMINLQMTGQLDRETTEKLVLSGCDDFRFDDINITEDFVKSVWNDKSISLDTLEVMLKSKYVFSDDLIDNYYSQTELEWSEIVTCGQCSKKILEDHWNEITGDIEKIEAVLKKPDLVSIRFLEDVIKKKGRSVLSTMITPDEFKIPRHILWKYWEEILPQVLYDQWILDFSIVEVRRDRIESFLESWYGILSDSGRWIEREDNDKSENPEYPW